MSGAAPDLSVVVVSHGHEAMLPRCLGSLAPALDGLSAEMLVIDNLPSGGAAAALAGLPARVVGNAVPLGFAANVNRGAAATTGRHLLFLNPDTEHRAGRIAEALDFLAARPRIGLLGCTLLEEDGSPQQSFRRFPSPAVPIARGLGADRWPWRPAWYRRAMMVGQAGEEPFPVDWIFGAFLLMRRADFERVGGMDEGYRLYYEDIDLAWRLRRLGLATWVHPGLRFLHAHQRASAKRPFSRAWRWHVAGALRYFARTAGRRPDPEA
ncbi:glycosyltransferase [Neoroseomonas soli]|uniref:Glycosyltransferase family 2 protein n=1 Tax=Neoroseomonas soli TaxID=1081025 RepID=A0A9X9WUV9_9PROT|nr:glycosyltransferase family 2 protein [Neoroseomonas soli]MBR0670938.1 glycosyltransferase family 2 protein [Neoroseomonas soli]